MKPIQELVQLLLSKEFFDANKHRIRTRMFDDSDYEQIYKSILRAHEKTDDNITMQDVAALYEIDNPSESRAKKENVRILLRDLASRPTLSPDVAEEVLQSAWRMEVGRDIMDMGNDILDGNIQDLTPIKRLLEKTKDDFTPSVDIKPCTKDVFELLKENEDDKRWTFNVRALRDKLPGVAGGELCIIFARPETGKTASHVSFCYGPDGFAEQGASVHTFVNEEKATRTMLRAMSSFTGITREEIYEDPRFVANEWRTIHDNVNMFDAQGVTIEQIDAYCENHKPDVLVVDQLDKVQVAGNFSRTDEKLREIYTQAREIAKRHDLAFIAISQASADAEGKTKLNPTEMEGSKTGKFAEADIIIGIGKHDTSGVDEEPDYTRHLTIGKNKITGWHGTIICEIQPKLSRYVD
jgi:replicative DNA helicase